MAEYETEKGLHAFTNTSPDHSLSSPRDDTKGRQSSVVNQDVLVGEVYDERYDSTHRGLKSRHAQMIALGGTMYVRRDG